MGAVVQLVPRQARSPLFERIDDYAAAVRAERKARLAFDAKFSVLPKKTKVAAVLGREIDALQEAYELKQIASAILLEFIEREFIRAPE